MPRQARLDAPGTLHHVMIRGIERSPIFNTDKFNKEICFKEGVSEQELRLGVWTRKYSGVRAKISYHLSHEFGVSRAENSRQMGACTSAIAKAIQNIEAEGHKC
jgi:hypothetical protein